MPDINVGIDDGSLVMQDPELLHPEKESSKLYLSKDERYELIALAVQAVIDTEECKSFREDAQQKMWDANDIDINLESIIHHYD